MAPDTNIPMKFPKETIPETVPVSLTLAAIQWPLDVVHALVHLALPDTIHVVVHALVHLALRDTIHVVVMMSMSVTLTAAQWLLDVVHALVRIALPDTIRLVVMMCESVTLATRHLPGVFHAHVHARLVTDPPLLESVNGLPRRNPVLVFRMVALVGAAHVVANAATWVCRCVAIPCLVLV